MNRLPAALFIVDVVKENIAVKEAKRLGVPVFAMVDTNSDPKDIDFVIPSNDDASKSIEVIVGAMTDAINEGLMERKVAREEEQAARKEKEAAAKEKAADKAADKAAKAKVEAAAKAEDKVKE
jgi:small subunit ribosomal protein S2